MACAALCSVIPDCCRCVDTKYAKTSITDIRCFPSNTMTVEVEGQQGLHGTRCPIPPISVEWFSLIKIGHPEA